MFKQEWYKILTLEWPSKNNTVAAASMDPYHTHIIGPHHILRPKTREFMKSHILSSSSLADQIHTSTRSIPQEGSGTYPMHDSYLHSQQLLTMNKTILSLASQSCWQSRITQSPIWEFAVYANTSHAWPFPLGVWVWPARRSLILCTTYLNMSNWYHSSLSHTVLCKVPVHHSTGLDNG